jgi:hypothetical protein
VEFKRKKPDCVFTVPDRPTVRQQLQYFSNTVSMSDDEDLFFRYWRGATALISDWKCEILPDFHIDLDKADDPNLTNLIIWAGLQVRDHMNSLEALPKN